MSKPWNENRSGTFLRELTGLSGALLLGFLFVIHPNTDVYANENGSRVKGSITEEGELNGAPFLIEIPENWNGGLLMYAHGYVMVIEPEPEFQPDTAELGHYFGMAVAQSLYSRQGWAAEEGILETEALRAYFVKKYGKTSPTIIAGHSQGGAITYASIERYADEYDGALPLCGLGGASLTFFKERVFDMRVLFDYYFPGLPGTPVDFPDGENTFEVVMEKASELIEANPEKAQVFADLVNLSSPEVIPDTLAFWSEILRELQVRAGGNPFDNRDTIYEGIDDDLKLNAEVSRYSSDNEAADYLRNWVTISGEISDPVLAVHTIVDDLIPPDMLSSYDELTNLANSEKFFVQQYTVGLEHCAFSTEETKAALESLLKWIESGTRPTSGLLQIE